ncbi:hypothetical protein ACKGJN_08600 [Gillisia sp. Q332]
MKNFGFTGAKNSKEAMEAKKPIDEEELVARINVLLARIMKPEIPEIRLF